MKIVYAIPGLGTTKELFSNLKIENAELRVLEWPSLDKNETMRSLAQKMASQINDAGSVSFYLLGVSFGGMLCVEIARIKKPERTILISSCKCRNELPWILRLFKYLPVHRMVPEKQHRILAKNAIAILGFDRSFKKTFHKMIDEMKPHYFKRAMDCIMNWNASDCDQNGIIHIHGNADKLLWFKNVKADYCIENGSHAMIIDKAAQLNVILKNIIE